MGVNGYALLEIANSRNITAVMLTAHAFTPEHQNGISTWNPWGKRLPSSYFEERWGVAWKDKDKGFWDKFLTGIRDKGKKPDKYN